MRPWTLFFSFRGRLRRAGFFSACLAVGSAFVALFLLLETALGRGSTLALYPPFFWSLSALTTKRIHDRGCSSAWLALLLVPILGPLWLAIDLGLRRGTRGDNRYGGDPLAVPVDYKTVA